MKINASMPSPFLFNPQASLADAWPTARQAKPRRVSRALSLAVETHIDSRQEVICGVILMLCLLSGMAAFVAQFVLA